MTQGLIYTSAPQGLNPGSRGFCTVAASEALGKRERQKLENLSGYEFAFNLSDENPERNPVNFLHTQVSFGAERRQVLSRVAYCGADYSNRTNKIAHHLLLGGAELVAPGPAWALVRLARSHFVERWEEDPRALEDTPLRTLVGGGKGGAGAPLPCDAWGQAAGDAGWGGALARAFRRDPNTPAFVVFEPGTDMLALFAESLALLPADERWKVCFSTYYTGLPPDCPCHWRGVLAGSKAAGQVRRFPNATVIDLTTRPGSPRDDVYAACARQGTRLPPPDQIVDEPVELVDPGAGEVASLAAPAGHWAELGLKPPGASRRRLDGGQGAAPWVAVGVVGLVVMIGLALFWPKGPGKRVEVIPKLETKTLASLPTPKAKTVAKTAVAKTEVSKTVAKTSAPKEPVEKTEAVPQPEKRPERPKEPAVRTVRLEEIPRTLVGEANRHPLTFGHVDGAAWVFVVPDGGVTHLLEAPKGAPLRFRRDGDARLIGTEVMEQLAPRFVPIARVSARATPERFELRMEAVHSDAELRGLLPLLGLELLNEKTGALYPLRAHPIERERFELRWTPADGFRCARATSVLTYPLGSRLALEVRVAGKKSNAKLVPDGKARAKWIRVSKYELPFRFVATRDPQQVTIELRPKKLLDALNAAILDWDPAELFGLRKAKNLQGEGRKRLAELEVSEAQVVGLIDTIRSFELTIRDAWGLPVRRLVIDCPWGMPEGTEK